SAAVLFFFSSRRRHTRSKRDWSSDVCSSDLVREGAVEGAALPESGEILERAQLEPHAAARSFGFEPAPGGGEHFRSDVDGVDRRSEERRVGKGWSGWREARR